MKYLFWNTNKKNGVNVYLKQLLIEYSPDIVGLAEYTNDIEEVLTELHSIGITYYYTLPLGSRIITISKFRNEIIMHREENTYFVVKGYPYNNGEIHNVVFLHLPSKREDAGGRRTAVLRKVREAVISCDKNVIIGDFNMNPYEKIMTSVIEMNAVSSVQIAKRQKRKFVEDEYRFYYNPMWNFLGDKNIPQGTHYYSTSEEESVYWNIFDQIIVSSALVDDVDIENIKIIDMLDKVSLNKNGKPDPSDHFPIYCELKGER